MAVRRQPSRPTPRSPIAASPILCRAMSSRASSRRSRNSPPGFGTAAAGRGQCRRRCKVHDQHQVHGGLQPRQFSRSGRQSPTQTSGPTPAVNRRSVSPNTPKPPPVNLKTPISGTVKVATIGANTLATTVGFINQSATGRIPYTGSITSSDGLRITEWRRHRHSLRCWHHFLDAVASPLTPGTTTNVTGTSIQFRRPSQRHRNRLRKRRRQFLLRQPHRQPWQLGQQIFVFGGVPVAAELLHAATTSPQFLAFTVQPDPALSSGANGQAQTVHVPARRRSAAARYRTRWFRRCMW